MTQDLPENDVDVAGEAEDWEAEDWDQEALGLDWSESEAQSVLREVVPVNAPD